MGQGEAINYIKANCAWEDVINRPPEWKTIEDIPEAKAILAVYPGTDLGIFADDEYNMKMACVFAPIIMEGDRWVTYVFVNNEGKVVGVFISGP